MDDIIILESYGDNTLLGVIVGGIIALISSFLLECFRCKKAEKLRFLQKKEETYIKMQNFIVEMLSLIHI